ncbi:MAG TPA: vanadium-dependent haloperoxidase [Candidatus Limnocylindrales bacterium]
MGRAAAIGIAAILVGGCIGGPSPSLEVPSIRPSLATPSASPTPPAPSPVPTTDPSSGDRGCTPSDHPDWSVARRWDEALLDAIRRALPNPPVHARNLFHVSVAMWDAWATYDPVASGYLTHEKVTAANVRQARAEAISFAAWTVLKARFENANGAEDSLPEFDQVLRSLCYLPSAARSSFGTDPVAVGVRIGDAVLAYGLGDGSNEADGYADPDYTPVNAPLVVASSKRFSLVDPTRWQPLEIIGGFSQNGIPTGTTQVAVDPQWGSVKAFGATSLVGGTPIDPGPPPNLGDPATDATLKANIVEVIRDSSLLDPSIGKSIDISPATRGANDLGTNDGPGWAFDPASHPYQPELVNQADFYRAAAEFWADGPHSETPPGHWNVIANDASDAILAGPSSLRIGGAGQPVDRLEWDVKLYLALNAAVHDAAIVSWGLKGKYDSIRPISLIRYMGGLGQSSNPGGPSYNPEGLPLVPGLIEVVTSASSAPGQRHHALAKFVGRIAIHTWAGSPQDPATEVAGDRWQLATAWVPYQLPTFVTPSFPAYASGHSTFSRAAAEVLAAFTGSEFFPGGLGAYTIPAGSLQFEHGPTTDVVLEWATYFDAADQAGQSRLFGGIHIQADDFTGRRLGEACGRGAWRLAQEYFAGRVNPDEQACEALPAP